MDIIEGRKIDGFRITKEIRKEIKFAMKRGDKADQLRKILLGRGIFGSVQKTLIKN